MAGRSLDIRRGKAKYRIAEWKMQETTTRAVAMVVFCLATIFSLWQMIYISEWPSALFNDILSCIERWCTLRNESTPICNRFIFARLTACSGCLMFKGWHFEMIPIKHQTVGWKEFPVRVSTIIFFRFGMIMTVLSEWRRHFWYDSNDIHFDMTAKIWPSFTKAAAGDFSPAAAEFFTCWKLIKKFAKGTWQIAKYVSYFLSLQGEKRQNTFYLPKILRSFILPSQASKAYIDEPKGLSIQSQCAVFGVAVSQNTAAARKGDNAYERRQKRPCQQFTR